MEIPDNFNDFMAKVNRRAQPGEHFFIDESEAARIYDAAYERASAHVKPAMLGIVTLLSNKDVPTTNLEVRAYLAAYLNGFFSLFAGYARSLVSTEHGVTPEVANELSTVVAQAIKGLMQAANDGANQP